MKSTACAAALLALWCSAGPCLAEEQKAPPCDLGRNAALTYWRAFAHLPVLTKEESPIVEYPPYLPLYPDQPKSTPEQRADLAMRLDDAMYLLHEAVQIPDCNWGVDYEKEGERADLTHLAKARNLTKYVGFRARVLWEQGKRKEAAECLRDAIIMSRQIGNDGHDGMNAVLTQIACESLVFRTLAGLLTDREAADTLASVLGDLVNDPAAPLVANGTLSGKKQLLAVLRRMFSADPEGAIAQLITSKEEQAKALAKMREISPAEAERQWFDDISERQDEAAALYALPYQEFLAKWKSVQEKLDARQNPLAQDLGDLYPHRLSGPREYEEAYRVQWAMIRAAIEIRREGESALSRVLNPADGKPFLCKALKGGAFELTSSQPIPENRMNSMTFGCPPAKKE
jgi:hypothetical protein